MMFVLNDGVDTMGLQKTLGAICFFRIVKMCDFNEAGH